MAVKQTYRIINKMALSNLCTVALKQLESAFMSETTGGDDGNVIA